MGFLACQCPNIQMSNLMRELISMHLCMSGIFPAFHVL